MIYEVAGLTFEMTPQFPRLAEQAKNYCADGIPAFQVAANPREWQAILRQKEKEAETARMQEYAEYICCSADFCRKLPEHGRFYLHASAVVLDGRGYLFSAPSGTGKSTHTSLWLREFPGSFLLNDDKPVIWPQKDGITVWGSPFSGKTNLQVNQGVPLQGICFLKRGKHSKGFFTVSCPLFHYTIISVIHSTDIQNLLFGRKRIPSGILISILIHLLVCFINPLCLRCMIHIIIVKIFF